MVKSPFAYGLRYLDRGNAQEVDPVALSLKNKSAINNWRRREDSNFRSRV